MNLLKESNSTGKKVILYGDCPSFFLFFSALSVFVFVLSNFLLIEELSFSLKLGTIKHSQKFTLGESYIADPLEQTRPVISG